MERQILFRVWNQEKKTLTLGLDLYMLAGYLTASYPRLKAGNEIFMQFVGRPDKNGVPMYEGDICRQIVDGHKVVAPMIWNNSRLQFGLDARVAFKSPSNVTVDVLSKNDEPEVIGNIYENPELLNGTKN